MDEDILIIDNNGLYFKTVYEGAAVEETIDSGKLYSFVNAVITLDNTGSGIIVFIVSTDSGVSWKAWNGSSWVLVNITNMEDVKIKGMIVSVLQGISEAQWTSLGLSDKKIRFAWYMEITSSTDILKLKEIRVNYNTM
ncbi:hypothetical protein [Clostridium kluyveri]|uniref:Uncharacterized protein n=1 Tax=Clostridium kluyveri TaxID=1534 RepID=A0A1L5FAJ8_CLOKL|nr:hypothetical protein [Clostridium kluyveri]APM39850.1 hypothetical protein BS101_14465 [Clostridium kluyveri]